VELAKINEVVSRRIIITGHHQKEMNKILGSKLCTVGVVVLLGRVPLMGFVRCEHFKLSRSSTSAIGLKQTPLLNL
jgi:hypothetical protein